MINKLNKYINDKKVKILPSDCQFIEIFVYFFNSNNFVFQTLPVDAMDPGLKMVKNATKTHETIAQNTVSHPNVICDACDMDPIHGIRFKVFLKLLFGKKLFPGLVHGLSKL
jgi:hypothetical protein